jgi:hypothetical protein
LGDVGLTNEEDIEEIDQPNITSNPSSSLSQNLQQQQQQSLGGGVVQSSVQDVIPPPPPSTAVEENFTTNTNENAGIQQINEINNGGVTAIPIPIRRNREEDSGFFNLIDRYYQCQLIQIPWNHLLPIFSYALPSLNFIPYCLVYDIRKCFIHVMSDIKSTSSH